MSQIIDKITKPSEIGKSVADIQDIEDYVKGYKYGGDYLSFVKELAVILSETLGTRMTAIFMDVGKAFTLDAIHGSLSGKVLKMSVLGGGNFEELLSSSDDYLELKEDLYFRTPENKRICLMCMDAGFKYVIPLKIDEKIVGMIFTERLDDDYFNGESGTNFKEILSLLSQKLRLGKADLILEKESLRKVTMIGLTEKLSAITETEDLLKSILDYLKSVVDYDAAGIFLIEGDNKKIKDRYQVGFDLERLDKVDMKVGKGIIGTSIELRKAILTPDVSLEPKYVVARQETKSEICVPLIRGDKVLGAFNVENDKSYAYGFDDLDMLTGVANIAAVVIDNARLFKISKEKQEIERDIKIAADIQKALLPHHLPEVEGLDMAASTIQSKMVGGDLYDVSMFASGRVSITIGDVSGKGIPAAILMANLYASYKGLARTNLPVEELVNQLNLLIYGATDDDRFATFFYGVYDPEDKQMAYCNGGHNPPLVIRSDGKIELLEAGGPAIGFVTDKEYKSGIVKFNKGDYLLLYTDGVTEAENRNGDFYGIDKLSDISLKSRGKSAIELHDNIIRDLQKFSKGSMAKSDDVTLISIRII